jgi:hypothetical protein
MHEIMTEEATPTDWEEYQEYFHIAPDSHCMVFSAFAHDSARLFTKDLNKLSVEIWRSKKQITAPPAAEAILGSPEALKNAFAVSLTH